MATFLRTGVVTTLAALTCCVALSSSAADREAKKPAEFALVNKAKDMFIVSSRDEPILDYFRRNRILVGGVLDKGLGERFAALEDLLQAKKPLNEFWVSYASQNDDPKKAATFGAWITVMPPSPAVAKLLKEHKLDGKETNGLTLILQRDEKKPAVYHVVGYTKRTPVGFFGNAEKNAADGFSQKDLCFKSEPKN
jgi:hypothetical protein